MAGRRVVAGPVPGDRASRLSERVYRALLVAYPKRFRDAYGPQMVRAFRDVLREERLRGGAAWPARLWARTLPDLAASAFAERREDVIGNNEEVAVNNRALALAGLVLLLAPLYFISASLLKYGLGVGLLFDPLDTFLSVSERRHLFNMISPVVFLGGLILALVLNARAILRVGFGREDGELVGTARLRLKPWNMVVAATSCLLLVILLGYVFLENFAAR
jgi:hypothetical protein